MHPGWAAHSGIVATTMAAAGFRGPATVFEGAGGLYQSHLGKVPDAAGLGLDDLGTRWMTLDIALKPYPCCHFTHAFVDGAAGVLEDLGRDTLSADEVESIECPIHPMLIPMVAEPRDRKVAPQTIYDALFSVPFVVAQRLSGGRLDLSTFYDEPLDDPNVLALAGLVRCVPDPSAPFPARFPGEVVIRLTDGSTARRVVVSSHGTPGDLMEHDEVVEKLGSTAGRAAGPDQLERLAELVGRLDRVGDVTELLAACKVEAAPGEVVES
jgi:2-methylcitrate dehydratase PrpD